MIGATIADMHSPRRPRPSLTLGWAVVVLLCGAAALLLQAEQAGFGWACALLALTVVFVIRS
jgi:hypothetical protein